MHQKRRRQIKQGEDMWGFEILDLAIGASIAILFAMLVLYINLPKVNVVCRTKLGAVSITKAVMLSEITLAIKTVDNFKVLLVTNNLNINYFHVLLSRLSKTIVKINFNDSAIDSIAKIYKLINKLNNASSKERAVLVKLINVELSSILLELKKI